MTSSTGPSAASSRPEQPPARRRRVRGTAAGLAAAVLLAAACGDDAATAASSSAPPTTAAVTAAPSVEPEITTLPPTTAAAPTTTTTAWVVGATPLPLRSDGFGEVLPTPAQLVRRSLPTVDVLPPPPPGTFQSTVQPIDDALAARMSGTWQEGCPVGLDDLRYVTVSFRGFDGRDHTGELVVHEDHAEGIVGVFRTLFDAGFPIEEMRLVTAADLAAPPTGDGNNTAAFVCRFARGTTRFSAHASGLAIDVNPFLNPYTRGDLVLPELASAYLDRDDVRPGMVLAGDLVVQAFASIGWSWGGDWDEPRDLMHFTATGG